MTEGLNLYVFYFCIFFSIVGCFHIFAEHRLAANGLALNIIRLLSNINLAGIFSKTHTAYAVLGNTENVNNTM